MQQRYKLPLGDGKSIIRILWVALPTAPCKGNISQYIGAHVYLSLFTTPWGGNSIPHSVIENEITHARLANESSSCGASEESCFSYHRFPGDRVAHFKPDIEKVGSVGTGGLTGLHSLITAETREPKTV